MPESLKANSQLGRYRLVTTLGQGGMGTIWLAVTGGLGEFRKLLVVKELRRDLTRNPKFVEMFMDEAKLAARLSHPNVVQTLEAGQEGDRYFLSMEFLDGQPLSEVLERAAFDLQLSLGVRLRILCGALSGLHYAHELRDYDGTELQIVHRDVSPQNVFVTYDGQVKVVDFGIAKAADADTFTQPGVFKGKFAYASPEQVKGQPVDRRTDVFAMGVLLWEMVTIQRFAKGKPTQASLEARLQGKEPRLSQAAPEVEPLLAEICDRAMAVEPKDRFASADELRLALEQYLFVSGERVESATIAGIMQTAFAEERASMHRMIDSHLKDADLSESLVRPLRLTANVPGQDDPTTVADLSELVESSRVAPSPVVTPLRPPAITAPPPAPTPLGFAASATPRPSASTNTSTSMVDDMVEPEANKRRVWLGAGALLGVAALLAYALLRGSSAKDIDAVTTTPLAPAPAASELVPEAPPALPAAVVPAAPAPPAAPAAANAASPAAPAPSALTTPRVPRVPPPERAAAVEGAAANEGAARAPRDEPRASIKAEPAAPVQPSVEPAPEPMGEDLRSLRKAERRKLDLEDPFQ